MKKDIEYKLNKEKKRRLNSEEIPEFIEDFIFNLSTSKSLRTQVAYLKDLTVFFQYLKSLPNFKNKQLKTLSPLELKEITEKDILNFLDYLSHYEKTFKKKNGEITIQSFSNDQLGKARKLAALRTLYKYLTKNKALGIIDPTKHIDIKINKKKVGINKLDEEEISLFLDTIENDVNIESKKALSFHQRQKYRDYIIILILGFTGIRISELVQLDINDINLDKGFLVVTRKGGDLEEIDLPNVLLDPLGEYLLERKKITGVDTLYQKALFLSSQKKRINERTVRYNIEKYKKRSGLTIDITPHTFRRSFGMRFYNKTQDIELTRDVMGHSTVETTRKFYAQSTKERKRKAMQEFNYFDEKNKLTRA